MESTNSVPSMDIVDARWDGPIPFKQVVEGDGIPDTFYGPGVYIWTVCTKGRHVAYYVGESGHSIRDRTIEHYKCYLHGEYRVYDPAEFAIGKKDKPPVWGDAYGYRWPNRVGDFLQQAPSLLPIISQFVGLLEMFVIPFGKPSRIRKRLEAEIHRLCKAADGHLQDKDIKCQPTEAGEQSVTVSFTQPIPVAGLEGLPHIDLAYRPPKRVG